VQIKNKQTDTDATDALPMQAAIQPARVNMWPMENDIDNNDPDRRLKNF